MMEFLLLWKISAGTGGSSRLTSGTTTWVISAQKRLLTSFVSMKNYQILIFLVNKNKY